MWGRIRWQVRTLETATFVGDLLCAPDAFLGRSERLLRDMRLVTVGRVALPGVLQGRWLLQRTHYGKPVVKWRDIFRTAGVLRAFWSALAMKHTGVAIPKVLAGGVVRFLRIPQAGYLLVQEIDFALTLAECFRQPCQPSRDIIHGVAETIAQLEASGFIQRIFLCIPTTSYKLRPCFIFRTICL